MPIVGFVALGANLVRPVCNGCEARIADQRANPPFRVLGQAGLGEGGDDFVPFSPPAEKGRRHERRQDNGCRDDYGMFRGVHPLEKASGPGFIIKNGRGRFDGRLVFHPATVTFGQEIRLVLEFGRES